MKTPSFHLKEGIHFNNRFDLFSLQFWPKMRGVIICKENRLMAKMDAVTRLRGAIPDMAPGQPCPLGLLGKLPSLRDPMEEMLTRDPCQESRG